MDFKQLIKKESEKIEYLHAEIHRTYQHRNLDKRAFRLWEEACKTFHSYVSPLDAYLERICSETKYSDIELIEFAVCFLELDAWFFRSGYLKQVLITRLNRSELKEEIKRRLRWVLMDAVNCRGTREFKYYCRMAVYLANVELIQNLATACESVDSARANRAKMMLKYTVLHSNKIRKEFQPTFQNGIFRLRTGR